MAKPALAMPPFVQSTQGYDVKNGLKVVLYGKAAHGKTRSLSTLPNPIILSHEGGLLSLRALNIPFIAIRNFAELQYYTQWLTQTREGMSFQSIGIDSLSDIAEACLKDVKSRTKDGRAAYGEMAEQITDFIRFYRDLPGRNVVMTAKEEWEKDEATGRMLNRPSMPGKKLTVDLPYFFDEVFQACRFPVEGAADQFAFRTKPDLTNEAKDRSGVLDAYEHPDFSAILAKINAKG